MSTYIKLARVGAPVAALGLALLPVASAAAHVSVTASTTAAGSYTIGTFAVPHGCDGSPTTRVAISIPEQILSVKPTRNAFWDVRIVIARLPEPKVDAHGNEVTERVSEIVYTAGTPLPDGVRDAFELSFQVPGAVGETLTFPIIQTCQKGETAWTEVPAAGQDEEELEHPAPSFVITAPDGDGDGHDAASSRETAASAEPETVAKADDSASADGPGADGPSADGLSGDGFGAAGLAAGVLGLLAGGAALVQVRRLA
jgi:uncharacterized protein YcnI